MAGFSGALYAAATGSVPPAAQDRISEQTERFLPVSVGRQRSTVGETNLAAGTGKECAGAEETVRSCLAAGAMMELMDGAAQARAKESAARIAVTDLPKGAALLTGTENGELAVYVRDDADVLSMMVKKPGQPLQVLFENQRKWQPPEN